MHLRVLVAHFQTEFGKWATGFIQPTFFWCNFFSQCTLSLLMLIAFSLFLACPILTIFLSCPRFNVGTQSTLYLSQPLAACPETKCLPHMRSSCKIFIREICSTYCRNPARSPLLWQYLGFFSLICNYSRYASEIYTIIAAASISTPNNNTQHHCFCEELTWICLHFCTPIWRRSDGCQDFCHVSENDLLKDLYGKNKTNWNILAHLEHVPPCFWITGSLLGLYAKLHFTNKCSWLCFLFCLFSKLRSYNTLYSRSFKASKAEFDASYLAKQKGKLKCRDHLRISTIWTVICSIFTKWVDLFALQIAFKKGSKPQK